MNEQELKDVIHKFRGEKAVPLHFQPSIELLVDSDFCAAIERTIHRSGIKWERRKATASLGETLPDAPGLYMFVWHPDFELRFAAPPNTQRFAWVLYVGKAGKENGVNATIKQRYLSEYSRYVGRNASQLWDAQEPTGREERLRRYLTLRPLEFWFLELSNIEDINVFERKLIRLFGPPLNQHYGPKIRPGKTVPAFEDPK